ncbi:MAG TPA: HAMP domain-containing protein [Novosphingobium capsulatum]|nr:HAMP domain-containing protein [Novosphingobium capsulatum]
MNGLTILSGISLIFISCFSIWTLGMIMEKDIADSTRHTVETAYGILGHYQKLEQQGTLSHEAARHQALEAIRTLRFNTSDYFWVTDLDGRMAMHPLKPALEGTDVRSLTDSNGNRMFADMIAVVKAKGAGFVEYHWDKPDGTRGAPKISYVRGFAPWNVLIGTGVYKDDIRYALLRQTGLLAVLAIAIIGGVLLVSRRIAASVATPIEDLTRRMAGLAGGDTQSPVPNLDRQDEIGGMSQALEVFRQAAIAQKTAEHDLHTAIDTVGQHLHALANGNLGARMHYIPPAYSVLLDHYNRAVEGLNTALGVVHSNTAAITEAATGIRDGSVDLAQRTEQEAAALERTARDLADVTREVRMAAQSAANAGSLVESTVTAVQESGIVMEQAVEAMKTIAQSSENIRQIIALIDGIAFQTNLLALNAGVEAARAGEAGRGFAVVADEVRALALRSARAAKDVETQIMTSVAQVQSGVGLVANVENRLGHISDQVEELGTLVISISESSQRQATSVDQINRAMQGLEQTTQHNTAMAEEATAACVSMARNASMLRSEVEKFDLGTTDTRFCAPVQQAA